MHSPSQQQQTAPDEDTPVDSLAPNSPERAGDAVSDQPADDAAQHALRLASVELPVLAHVAPTLVISGTLAISKYFSSSTPEPRRTALVGDQLARVLLDQRPPGDQVLRLPLPAHGLPPNTLADTKGSDFGYAGQFSRAVDSNVGNLGRTAYS